jgi:hypothetical protein
MTTIRSTTDTTSNQPVTKKTDEKPVENTTAAGTEFDTTLKSLIRPDGANKVSEEDLFSALVQERIKKEKGDETLQEFQTMLQQKQDAMRKPDGFVPVEDSTKAALIQLRDSGKLTEAEADTLYSKAFAGAQLDDNKEALFDNRGGAEDSSIAVATLEQALLSSRVQMEKYDSGELEVTMRSVSEASAGKNAAKSSGSGSAAVGSAGFLWKPISESDSKLVVLLPPSFTGLVESARLLGPNGDEIESGRYRGSGNGGREHFRFSQPGGNYPQGVVVEALLKNGEKVLFKITDPSQRTENVEGTGEAASTVDTADNANTGSASDSQSTEDKSDQSATT